MVKDEEQELDLVGTVQEFHNGVGPWMACHERNPKGRIEWLAKPKLALGMKASEGMVRKRGFEPPRSCDRQPLKLVRLPVPPLPR